MVPVVVVVESPPTAQQEQPVKDMQEAVRQEFRLDKQVAAAAARAVLEAMETVRQRSVAQVVLVSPLQVQAFRLVVAVVEVVTPILQERQWLGMEVATVVEVQAQPIREVVAAAVLATAVVARAGRVSLCLVFRLLLLER